MKDSRIRSLKRFFALCSIFLVLVYGCDESTSHEQDQIRPVKPDSASATSKEIAVSAPPLSDGIYPCSDCHAHQKPNPQRRLLEWHEEIQEVFTHDSANRWCLDCHDINVRDSLKFASGKLLSFTESYKLCGQCHGDKYRDWKVGVHGKRTGQWNGKRQYLLCVHCHDPHNPHFKKLKPEPPPVRQEDLRNQEQVTN